MKKLLAALLLLPLGAFAQDNWFEKPLKHVDVLDVADLGAFTPVSYSDKSSYRTMKSGYYKLNGYADFQLDGYLYIPLDAEVVIDLNGVGLDRSLEQDLKNGCVFVVEGKLLIRNEQASSSMSSPPLSREVMRRSPYRRRRFSLRKEEPLFWKVECFTEADTMWLSP